MLTLKVDKSSFNRTNMVAFVEQLRIALEAGKNEGIDWELHGGEQDEPETGEGF